MSQRLFKDKLQSLDFEVTWIEDQGKHDWDFWNKYIEKFLDWLPLDEAVAGVSSGNVRQGILNINKKVKMLK